MTTIYHNPRCSKSRQALQLLEEKGVEVPVRKYLEDPPSEADLRKIVKLLGIRPIELCRKGEKIYKGLGLSADMKDGDVIRLMVENPVLIERPVFVWGGKAVVGRPPENVLDLI